MRHTHALFAFALLAIAGCSTRVVDQPSVQSVAQGDSADDDKGGTPAEPGACTDGVLGDGVTCVSYGDIKTTATELCSAAGGGLTALDYDPQGCAEGEVPIAHYTCCQPADPGPAPSCDGGVIGDGQSCTDASAVKEEALALCAAAGRTLADLFVDAGGCGDGVIIAKYVCCDE
jgi:hypothetical protein